jgi:hypothetical protein
MKCTLEASQATEVMKFKSYHVCKCQILTGMPDGHADLPRLLCRYFLFYYVYEVTRLDHDLVCVSMLFITFFGVEV